MVQRTAVRGLVLVAVLTVAGGLLGDGGAVAAPQPTVAQVRHQVAVLRQQAESATEQYNAARENIASLNVRLSAARTQLVARRTSVDVARSALGRLAADTYKAGDLASLSLFLSDNPDGYVAANGTLVSLGDRRADAVGDLLQQRQLLVATTTDLQAQQQRLGQQQRDLQRTQQEIQLKLDQAAALLGRLTGQQRQQLTRDAATEYQASLTGVGIPVPPSGKLTCQDVPTGPVDARVSKVLGFACSELGSPYQWGGSGPARFDCSGLTMMAWKQAGVSLPHNAAMQATYGTKVALDALRPGDLVFFYSPIGHNGIYLGSGLILHAPQTGDVVKITPLRYIGGFTTAVRL
jgi:cell wall-associated NlpC family hydrolase